MSGSTAKVAVVASRCIASFWNADGEVGAGDDCAFGCALFRFPQAFGGQKLNRGDAEAQSKQHWRRRGCRDKAAEDVGLDSGWIAKERFAG
jgi:hypothetical protein